MATRKFRDRDFLRTEEGFFFCVVGPYHPPNRVISYLKYVPAELGNWGKGKWRFKRVLKNYTIPSLLQTFDFLEKGFPQYLFYSPFYNILMTAVPFDSIARHYKPEEKLAKLREARRPDRLQKKLVRFVSFLSDKSGVSPAFFGISGSILLNIHRLQISDIDLIVYGRKNSLAVKKALQKAYSHSPSKTRIVKKPASKAWCISKARIFPLTFDDAMHIYRRKWNIGTFEDTEFSVHPVKLEQEVDGEYGDKIYQSHGSVVLGAFISDNTDSLFLPAVYKVQKAQVAKGPQVADIKEVVSYEGLYSDIAEIGENILVKGKLELVRDEKSKTKYNRVVVGSTEGKGQEYIKLA
jgi:predicted nucleotidyltransferase